MVAGSLGSQSMAAYTCQCHHNPDSHAGAPLSYGLPASEVPSDRLTGSHPLSALPPALLSSSPCNCDGSVVLAGSIITAAPEPPQFKGRCASAMLSGTHCPAALTAPVTLVNQNPSLIQGICGANHVPALSVRSGQAAGVSSMQSSPSPAPGITCRCYRCPESLAMQIGSEEVP